MNRLSHFPTELSPSAPFNSQLHGFSKSGEGEEGLRATGSEEPNSFPLALSPHPLPDSAGILPEQRGCLTSKAPAPALIILSYSFCLVSDGPSGKAMS